MVRETMFTTVLLGALAVPGLALANPNPGDHVAAVDDDGDGDEPDDDGAPAPVAVAPTVHAAPAENGATAAKATEPAPAEGAEQADDDDDDDAKAADEPPELKFQWNGRIQSDLRFRPWDVGVTPWYDGRGLRAGVERNQNLFAGSMAGSYGRVKMKADVNLYLYGYTRDVYGFTDLTRREKIDPYRLDVQNLYVEVEDLFVKHFDLRVGQQMVDWGVGDQFNPTNNLNADDLEDVLLFGKQQGNFMVKGTYWLNDEWSHEAVLVPVFKPAVLPRSAVLGLSRVDRIPVMNDQLRWNMITGNSVLLDNPLGSRNPTVVRDAVPDLPDMSFDNMQFGYRLAGTFLNQDVSLSYYRGRFDFPLPYKNVVTQDTTKRCNPANASDCTDSTLMTDVHLMYPKMHVYGFNMTGEVGLLKKLSERLFHAVGYRLEAALIVPQQTTFQITTGPVSLAGFAQPAGEFNYAAGGTGITGLPLVTDGRAFAKWTAGIDYTFNETFYLNAQWVHGMADEFGAGQYVLGASRVDGALVGQLQCLAQNFKDGCTSRYAHEWQRARIGDYLVAGLDMKAMKQKLVLRIFTLIALNGIRETYFDAGANARVEKQHSPFSKDGYSTVLFPSATYNFGGGLEMSAGVLAQLGQAWTKFGDPAAGGTMVWTRANFAF